MKNVILLFSLLAFVVGSVFAQNDEYTDYDTASATYTGPTIGVDGAFGVYGDVSTCAVTHTVSFPGNAIAMWVDVEYNMISDNSAQMAYQRSQLWCTAPGGSNEPTVYSGTGYAYDTMSYNRTGLDIAYGIVGFFLGGAIDFELHTGSNHWSVPDGTCTTDKIWVEDGSYTVSLIYLKPGSPGLPSNPVPADAQLLVGLDDDLSWGMDGVQTGYKVYFGTTNPPVFADSIGSTATSAMYDPGTLTANTEYFWQIVTTNGVNQSPGKVWSFKTACDAPVYPYFEGFEDYTAPALPDCWVGLTNGNIYSTVETVSGTYNSHTGSMAIAFKSGDYINTDDSIFLVLPKVGTIADKWIQVWGKNALDFGPWSSTLYEFPYTIGTMSDPLDYTTFEPFQTYVPGEFYEPMEAFFKYYAGTDEYIAILAEPDFGQWLNIDDITVDLLPSCIKPLDLMTTEVQAEQATFSFTDLNPSPEFQVAYDTVGFDPNISGTFEIVTTNPFTITGLSSASYYDFYVRAICGVGDTSEWSYPIEVITECLPFAVPFFEDFGEWPISYLDPYIPPLCWLTIDIHGGEFGGVGFDNYEAYTGACVWMSPEGDVAAELILSGPELSVGINTLRTTFWAKTSSDTQDSGLIVGTITDPLDETTFTPYDTITGLTEEYQLVKVYFHNYVGTDNYIAWRHNSAEHPLLSVRIDDITVETIPACVEPYRPYADGMTASAAWINWIDPVETATDWEVEVGPIGFTLGSGTNTYSPTGTAGEMQSYEMTGLNAATVYDAYIRTNCGGGSFSVWEGPVTFMTGFASATLPYAEDFETGLGNTVNSFDNNTDFAIVSDLAYSGDSSVMSDPAFMENYTENALFLNGIFDLTAKADQMLTFWHIPKTDGNYGHCFVEISTDGGATFDALPISTYFGGGNYYVPTSYNPDVLPAFDETSYPEYGTSSSTQPDSSWWRKEYFDLSDYSAESSVVFRFRHYKGYSAHPGWWIDDIAIGDKGTPGFSIAPLAINEDASATMPVASVDLTAANAGAFPASYTADVVYLNETVLLDENFDAGTVPAGWTVNDNLNDGLTWLPSNNTSGYSFNGTYHMVAFSNLTASDGVLMEEELLTPAYDLTTYSYATMECLLSFDADYTVGDTARVFVYDGADWVMIAEYTTDVTRLTYNQPPSYYKKSFDVSAYMNSAFQMKFWYTDGGTRAYYMAVDDVKLRVSTSDPIGWLSIDGLEQSGGTALPDSDMYPSSVNVKMDATGLAVGTYNAEILVTSTDAGNPSTTIPVTFNVVAGSTISGNVVYDNTGMTAMDGATVELRDASDAVVVLNNY